MSSCSVHRPWPNMPHKGTTNIGQIAQSFATRPASDLNQLRHGQLRRKLETTALTQQVRNNEKWMPSQSTIRPMHQLNISTVKKSSLIDIHVSTLRQLVYQSVANGITSLRHLISSLYERQSNTHAHDVWLNNLFFLFCNEKMENLRKFFPR